MEPRIEHVKTECYFIDAAGAEWKVTGFRRAPDRWYTCGSSDPKASYRIFQRLLYRGPFVPIPLEVRAYRFGPGDERFSRAPAWQMQLEKSVVRSIRIPGYPRLPDGYLIPRLKNQ